MQPARQAPSAPQPPSAGLLTCGSTSGQRTLGGARPCTRGAPRGQIKLPSCAYAGAPARCGGAAWCCWWCCCWCCCGAAAAGGRAPPPPPPPPCHPDACGFPISLSIAASITSLKSPSCSAPALKLYLPARTRGRSPTAADSCHAARSPPLPLATARTEKEAKKGRALLTWPGRLRLVQDAPDLLHALHHGVVGVVEEVVVHRQRVLQTIAAATNHLHRAQVCTTVSRQPHAAPAACFRFPSSFAPREAQDHPCAATARAQTEGWQ